jgi:hypothetical protein
VPEGEGAHLPDAIAPPDDANDLRGHHFKLLMGSGKTWALILIPAVVIAALLAALLHPLIGAIALVVLVLAGVVIAFVVADSRAADAFFSLYASQRELQLGGKAPLPPLTPLLGKGNDRYAERTLSGRLAPDCDGILALFTYEEEHTDSNGNRDTSYYHYTLGLTAVPDCVRFVPELYCQRKFGLRALEKFEDVFRRSKERVKLESEVLDDKYEIFSTKDQDAVWLRRLFAPSFIVWLTDEAPAKFAFELVGGNLCCYVNGHKEDAADLDTLSAATAAVARRLREEANESS